MNLRESFNENSPMYFAAGIACVLVVLGLFAIKDNRAPFSEANPRPRVHFVDLETQDVFVGNLTELPPISSLHGNEAVLVHLFRCPSGSDGTPIIGHYEKYTEAARADFVSSGATGSRPLVGRLVSADGRVWYSATSREGERIMEAPLCPDGSFAIRILP